MPDSVECGSCGTQLSEEYASIPRKLCPNCGATNRVLSMSVHTKFNLSDAVIASQRYGHTGREVLGAEAERRAVEWASLTNRDDLLSHQLAEWPKWTSSTKPAFRLISPARPHEHIAVAAYYLWEKDGRAHGRDQAHWFQAIKDLK
jgi:Protein of unknown function (DUF2934)